MAHRAAAEREIDSDRRGVHCTLIIAMVNLTPNSMPGG
ncbi:hypothetical protein DFR49_2927 [Hephaestia caeni]|uniref:Uncharacterized protein n=1 Tax=Hephaestia caeni TaxID=645617 RepID=A0A397P8M1_9SPHN|nr:hypothetical protein DFR49_2927 [Hephaestia caeni]